MSKLYYRCKVLTPEFNLKLKELIKKLEVGNNTCYEEWMQIFHLLWEGESSILKVVFQSTDSWVLTPIYEFIVFEAKETIFQRRPRVLFNGEVRKIDDILEILDYAPCDCSDIKNIS